MRLRVAVAVACAAACAWSAQAALAAPAAWQPEKATYGVGEHKNVAVTMSDGVVLRANVFYPVDPKTGAEAEGPFPVLIVQTPYGKDIVGSASGQEGGCDQHQHHAEQERGGESSRGDPAHPGTQHTPTALRRHRSLSPTPGRCPKAPIDLIDGGFVRSQAARK